jgi:hypothetical protein
VLSFPIGLRILFAAHPQLLAPVLQIIHRVIAIFLTKQAGLKHFAADTDAVTLIQRFGSAANLNIHLHCLVLDGTASACMPGCAVARISARNSNGCAAILRALRFANGRFLERTVTASGRKATFGLGLVHA